jgi:hypothetical protein
MAIYPGASVRLIDIGYLSGLRMATYNRVNLHVAAGYGSLAGFFNQPRRASSHFWVAKSGLVEQYVDTSLRAEADLHGNDATVSIETESKGEPWTEAQVVAIINLVGWICDTHHIPKQLAQNSQVGPTSKGISWHRLGIDGNFPPLPSRYAGRLQRGGGMQYSLSRGKTCPVEGPIDQIYDRIGPGVAGGSPQPVPPNPVPVPTPPTPGNIATDGMWGAATTTKAQRVLGTPIDGEVWYQYKPNAQPAWTTGWKYNYEKGKGSALIAAMQRGMGIPDDGVAGDQFIRAFQKRMGTTVDGELWANSPAVKEFQRRLNNGTW